VTNAARTARSSSPGDAPDPGASGSVTFARRAAASSVLSCGQAALPAMAWATSLSIVEFARLAGHSPEECLRTYAHTF
jgi:hypothetical protein